MKIRKTLKTAFFNKSARSLKLEFQTEPRTLKSSNTQPLTPKLDSWELIRVLDLLLCDKL